MPLVDQFLGRTKIEHVFVVEDSYEDLLASADPDEWSDPQLDENEAAAMCYTSGTTGLPKGVVYSHRSTMLHTLGTAAANPLGLGLSEQDAILPVVPMFHANAWGYPYIAAMQGAKQVFPGPHLDAESLLEDFVQERVTWTAGVPTIWLAILQLLDANPDKWDLSAMKGMLVGGSAAPRAMIAGFQERHGLRVCHGWGMTETSPVASMASLPGELAQADHDTQFDYIAMQGLPLPLVELRARDADGNEIPHDGETMAELEVRGPWVAGAYYDTPGTSERWTEDGWFRTGDIVSFDPRGHIQIKDRSKDVIKSGGEWISSVDLENALMAHPVGCGGGGDRGAGREVAGAAARRRRPQRGCDGDRGAAERVPRAALREVVAAGPDRLRRRDSEDGSRQVQEDGAARAVRAATGDEHDLGGGPPSKLGGDAARAAARVGHARVPRRRARRR